MCSPFYICSYDFWCNHDLRHDLRIKKISSIGNDNKNYTFFKISGAVFDEDMNIYVGDRGGYFIAKYDKNGKYIGRMGQYGQGPDDFSMISNLKYFNDKLYVWDIKNIRITVLNKNLKTIKYIKPDEQFFNMCVLKNKNFFCTYATNSSKDIGRLRILDFKGKVIDNFFNKNQYGEYKIKKQDAGQFAMSMAFSRIICNVSADKHNALIGFMYPLNPAKIFLIDMNGKIKGKFFLDYDKKYNYQMAGKTLKTFMDMRFQKKTIYHSIINSMFFYKNKYLVFINLIRVETGLKSTIDKNLCFVLNKKGELLEKIKLSEGLKFFSLTQDGYILGTDKNTDIPQVLKYKLCF